MVLFSFNIVWFHFKLGEDNIDLRFAVDIIAGQYGISYMKSRKWYNVGESNSNLPKYNEEVTFLFHFKQDGYEVGKN